MLVQEQHGKAIHAHAKAAIGWHAIAHGTQIIFIERMLLLFIIGAIAGAVLGAINYELVSVRWLKLTPAKAPLR